MIYAWTLLGFLTIGVALLIIIGFRSRSRTEQYMSVPRDYSQKIKVKEFENTKAIAPKAYDPKIYDIAPHDASHPAEEFRDHISCDKNNDASNYQITPKSAANKQYVTHDQPITGDQEVESEYEEALIMLREVKAMLLQGRPDRAIEHIRAITGVRHEDARQFVSDVENKIIG